MAERLAPGIGGAGAVRIGRVHSLLWMVLGLMFLQGVLGIYLNLFVPLTAPSDPNAVFPIVFGNPILTVHFLNALLLVALAATLLAISGGMGVKWLRPGSALLLLAFVVASYSGYHFVGSEDNVYSFAMEMGFFGAMGLTVLLIHRTRQPHLLVTPTAARMPHASLGPTEVQPND